MTTQLQAATICSRCVQKLLRCDKNQFSKNEFANGKRERENLWIFGKIFNQVRNPSQCFGPRSCMHALRGNRFLKNRSEKRKFSENQNAFSHRKSKCSPDFQSRNLHQREGNLEHCGMIPKTRHTNTRTCVLVDFVAFCSLSSSFEHILG